MGARIVCSQAAHDEPVEGEYLREVDARIGRLRGALVPQLRDELCLDRAEERIELADLVPQLGSEVGAALQPLDALLQPFEVEVVVLPRSVLRALEQLAKLHEPLGPRVARCSEHLAELESTGSHRQCKQVRRRRKWAAEIAITEFKNLLRTACGETQGVLKYPSVKNRNMHYIGTALSTVVDVHGF